jgi:DNA mismatch repair protein MutL
MSRIALLSEQVINKIAAGEVVERPASVVKELCENSVDAGARSVRVQLRGGGLTSIRVVDDGGGMTPEEATLAVQRHATSKLRDAEGLFSILTKGFRGEALPAIAAVSRFSLSTTLPNAAVGTQLFIEGGSPPVFSEVAPIPGTDIRVEELFFNTPARRKFLRREQTELGHVEDAVVRLALAHPEVAFRLDHEDRNVLTLPPASEDERERIAAALGSDVFAHLLPIAEHRLGLTVRGFVASPEHTLSTARGLYTFVNRRYIRDRGLIFAVQRGFQETLPAGRQPVAVVFIDMDPAAVDVNVHPQKLEVRFSDARGVTEAVMAAVSRALQQVRAQAAPPAATQESASHYAWAVEKFLSRANDAERGAPLVLPMAHEPGPSDRRPSFGEAQPDVNGAPPRSFFATLKFIGHLAKRFWICEGAGGTLVILDPHAAWERAHLMDFLDQVADVGQSDQRTLFARTVRLPPEEAELVEAGTAEFRSLGIDVEPFGNGSFAIKSLPQSLHACDAALLLSEACRVLPGSNETRDDRWVPVCRVLACHAAQSSLGQDVSQDSLRALFRRLDALDFSLEPRHPRVVAQQLPLLELLAKVNVQRPLS